MAYGDGSIINLGPNRWKVRVDFGRNPVSGKRQVVSRNVRGTKADARKVRDELREEQENGIKADASKTTLSQFIQLWAKSKVTSGSAAKDTVDNYLSRLAHVEAYIGNQPLGKIDAQMIERTYVVIKNNSGLGGTSMNMLHVLLKSVFKKAVDYDLIMRNPCDRVKAPQKDDVDRKSLSAADCARFASAVEKTEAELLQSVSAKEERVAKLANTKERKSVQGISGLGCIQVIRIALATGMRRGEIIGLEWGHVDLEDGIIRVMQTRTKSGENKPPKTKAGLRSIHVDAGTSSALRKWKALQSELLQSIGVEQSDDTPVCCSDVGGYMDASNFERFWRSFKKKNGFESLKLHELRHTQATQLLAMGMDIKSVQSRLGHANAGITMDFYAHPVEDNDKQAADLIAGLIDSSREGDSRANVSRMCPAGQIVPFKQKRPRAV